MGLGMGGIWAPMATEAMRGVPPMLAGAAAGVNNTLRQIGSVVGSAAVGALLQNQLATLPARRGDQAVRPGSRRSTRAGFVDGFAASAKGGIEVGAEPGGRRRAASRPSVGAQAAPDRPAGLRARLCPGHAPDL